MFYAVSHSQEAETPGNEEFVAKYQEMFGGETVPEDAADAYAAGEVLQATVEANKTVGPRGPAQARRLAARERGRDDPRPAELGRDGRPKGEFLIGQWQNGKAEIVLPEEAATSDTIIEGYKPGGGN